MAIARQPWGRRAYERAITDFSVASETLYVRAASGSAATADELERYRNTKLHLEIARLSYQDDCW